MYFCLLPICVHLGTCLLNATTGVELRKWMIVRDEARPDEGWEKPPSASSFLIFHFVSLQCQRTLNTRSYPLYQGWPGHLLKHRNWREEINNCFTLPLDLIYSQKTSQVSLGPEWSPQGFWRLIANNSSSNILVRGAGAVFSSWIFH